MEPRAVKRLQWFMVFAAILAFLFTLTIVGLRLQVAEHLSEVIVDKEVFQITLSSWRIQLRTEQRVVEQAGRAQGTDVATLASMKNSVSITTIGLA